MSAYPRARAEGIVTEQVDDELVVYDQATQTAHALSTDAASVWRQCDGHRSAKHIARRLGLDEARVAQALDELSAAELIEAPDGISRREVYKRMAKLGAAALSAPLISSLAVPAPSAAQSSTCGPLLGQPCVALYGSTTCAGSPFRDTCLEARQGCTCQNLGPCVRVAIFSRRLGTCM
jgi:DNA-binding transcriptional ArsR family regulator